MNTRPEMNYLENYEQMEELFVEWNVTSLFTLFKEEGINISELKMMKWHHVNYLLRNHPMGLRIRLEYHWEQWRRQLGKPVLDTPQQMIESHSCNNITNDYKHCCLSMDKELLKRRCSSISYQNYSSGSDRNFNNRNKDLPIPVEQNINENGSTIVETFLEHESSDNLNQSATTLCVNNIIGNNSNIASGSNMHAKINSTRMEILEQLEGIDESLSTPVNNNMNQEEIDEDANKHIKVNLEQQITDDERVSNKNNENWTKQNTNGRKRPNGRVKDEENDRTFISLRQILRMAGARGQALTKYYQMHKRLTPAQRSQLLQIIVDFFDAHDYHLSLHTSHNIECQILKMFPTEKLEYYRTEKRGKIYVKFSNKKRYKRDRLHNYNNNGNKNGNRDNLHMDATKSRQFQHAPMVFFSPNIENSNNLQEQQQSSYQQQPSNLCGEEDGQITFDQIKLEHLTDDSF